MDANDCVESTSKKFTENVHKEEGGGLPSSHPSSFLYHALEWLKGKNVSQSRKGLMNRKKHFIVSQT